MHEYTLLDIGDGETVVQCNDCGAYLINGRVDDVEHYVTCKPTDPLWFDDE